MCNMAFLHAEQVYYTSWDHFNMMLVEVEGKCLRKRSGKADGRRSIMECADLACGRTSIKSAGDKKLLGSGSYVNLE